MVDTRIYIAAIESCSQCPEQNNRGFCDLLELCCTAIGVRPNCPLPKLRTYKAAMEVNEFFFNNMTFMMELLRKYKRNVHNRIIGEVMFRMLEFAVEIGPDATGR